MGREVGGGIGMGKTCEPKAFSFQCMTKFTTKKKKMPFLQDGRVALSVAYLFPVIIQFCKGDRGETETFWNMPLK